MLDSVQASYQNLSSGEFDGLDENELRVQERQDREAKQQ